MGFLREYEALSSAEARRALLFRWLNERRHELFAELRALAPVFSTPDFFLLTRYDDVKLIIEGEAAFKVRTYPTSATFVLGKDKEDDHDQDRAFLSALLPPAEYKIIRAIAAQAARAFVETALSTDKEIAAIIQKDPMLSTFIKTNVAETKQAARGRIDLLAAFARLVPLAVVTEYFGVPEPSPEAFGVFPLPRDPNPVVTKAREALRPHLDPNFPCLFNWTLALSRAFRYATFDQFFAPNLARAKAIGDRAQQVRGEFARHVGALLTKPATLKSNSLIKRLADGMSTYGRSPEQTVRDTIGMIGGMVDNVGDTTCLALDVLLSHPSALEQAVEVAQKIETGPADQVESHREKLWDYIREALRFAPPVPYIPRTPQTDWTHSSGVVVPASRRVFAAVSSAMMDERKFIHPNEFRLDRPGCSEADDLFFGSGWHDCFGKNVGREQIIEMVRHLLLLPDIRHAPGIRRGLQSDTFSPTKFVIEFGPPPVQNALTAVMTIKAPEELHFRALNLLLAHAFGPVGQLLNQVGTVHFARFVFLENNTKLALITTFDGDFDTYIKHYIELAGPLFDLMLAHIKDAPPLPVREHRDEFVEYVRRCDIGSETPFYSAYPDLTVQDIVGRK